MSNSAAAPSSTVISAVSIEEHAAVLKANLEMQKAVASLQIAMATLQSNYDALQGSRVSLQGLPVNAPTPATIESTISAISVFVQCIALDIDPAGDLLGRQRRMLRCGDKLQNPLPIDTAVYTTPVLVSQRIRTVGRDADTMLTAMRSCRGADVQDVKLICAAGSSGTGKTHLAAAVGEKYVYTAVIRIALKGGALLPGLTAPWAELRARLLVIDACRVRCLDQSADTAAVIALCAHQLMELLIYCYVDATILAVEAGVKQGISTFEVLLELCLRFHRNGKSEAAVLSLFELRSEEWYREEAIAVSGVSPGVIRGVCERKLASYRDDLICRLDRLPRSPTAIDTPASLLLCVDEAGALSGLFSSLFVLQSFHTPARTASRAVGDSPDASVYAGAVATPPPTNWRRDWFYGLACLSCDIATMTRWSFFVTGTAFSIARFQIQHATPSPVRGSMLRVSPSVRFSVRDMRELLQYYWRIPDDLLEDPRISSCLAHAVGRPLFFVDAVFVPIFARVVAQPDCDFSVDWLEVCLRDGRGSMTLVLRERMREYLFENPRRLATGTGQTTEALVPRLVRAVLFKEPLELSENMLDEAIAFSLVPAAALSSGLSQLIRIVDEPLVQSALESVLRDMDVNDVMRLFVMPTLPSSSPSVAGIRAEEILAVYLALRTDRLILAAAGRPVRLAEVLRPLFIGPPGTYPLENSLLECRAVRAISMRGWDEGVCAFRKFVHNANGTPALDDSVILYDIPSRAGVDVMLLASVPLDMPRAGAATRAMAIAPVMGTAAVTALSSVLFATRGPATRRYQPVGFQLKNHIAATLEEVLRTLHPGSQYLTNLQRVALINRSPILETTGSHGILAAWNDYTELAQNFPELACNWVRVPTLSRTIDRGLYEFANIIANGGLPRTLVARFFDLFARVGLRWGVKQRNTAAAAAALEASQSPVVFASLQSDRWLTVADRQAFVSRSPSVVTLTGNLRLWLPVSLSEAEHAVHAAEARTVSAFAAQMLSRAGSSKKRARA